MRSRQDITDIFSTYVQFEADRFKRWLREPRLQKEMEKALSQVSDTHSSKQFWALYWHQHWQNKTHRLALMHLSAHVQEAGYWAAYKFTSRFESKQFSLADCFQVAFLKFEKGLSSFQPDRGIPLESFAKLFFSSTITNELRRSQEIDLCSDWLLLRKTSRKRLIESLKSAGFEDVPIQQYRLAWLCFNRLYVSQKERGTQQLPAPSADTWRAIAALYNKERLSQLTTPTPSITASQIETWLTDCIQWIRAYLQPTVASLNTPIPGGGTGEWQDSLSATGSPPLEQILQDIAQASRQDQQSRLRERLRDGVSQLETPEQQLLQLYYQQNLTQQKIAQQLEIKQYSVSRKLVRVRKKLLDNLIDWCQSAEGVNQSPVNIEQIAEILEVWLQDYFEQIDPSHRPLNLSQTQAQAQAQTQAPKVHKSDG